MGEQSRELQVLVVSWLSSEGLDPTSCPRFLRLRKERVQEKVWFPGRKPKHAKQSLRELIQQSEEDYVDFQQAGRELA